MRSCSWWVIAGLTLLVLGLLYFGGYYWYAVTYIPDEPVWKDSKNFLHSPRSDAQIGALFGAGAVILFTSAVSLIGIVKGLRTWRCVVAGLLGPITMAIAYLVQFARNYIA
jgi:hypothetical protein